MAKKKGGLSSPSSTNEKEKAAGGARRSSGSSSTPSSSGKKRGKDEEVVRVDVLQVQLRQNRTEDLGPDRLNLAYADLKRLGLKAGDWVYVHEHIEQESGKIPGELVLRAWPATNVPSGTVVGSPPLVSGQFPFVGSQAASPTVSIRPFRLVKLSKPPCLASSINCTISREAEGAHDAPRIGTQHNNINEVLWNERLRQMLLGQMVFIGLHLCITLFGQAFRFEIVEINGQAGERGDADPDDALASKLTALSVNDAEDDEDDIIKRRGDHQDESEVSSALHFYVVGKATTIQTLGPESWSKKNKTDQQIGPVDDHQPWAAVGGMEAAVTELRESVEQALKSPQVFAQHGLRPTRGLLLTGPPGTGKTTLLRAAAEYFKSQGYHIMLLSGAEVIGRLVGETEGNLRRAFDEAKARSPTVIIIDEVEALCTKRESTTSDMDKRLVSTFLALMDGFDALQKVVVLAATNRPALLDPAVRRPGRLDREIDIGVPGEEARRQILAVLLSKAGATGSSISEDIIREVTQRAHGFVGADLLLLCKEAVMSAISRARQEGGQKKEGERMMAWNVKDLKLTAQDLYAALKKVRPSALREVAVEVPRVRWTDIGGQEEVKMALQECVEWPLTRPEAFVRMGIAPPKGVLLYGPPGCSKTLMARALATESGMNFLAVKGPELLSKWLGESEKALQALFKKARAAAPTVIFFDEIDALAGRRGGSNDSKASERVLSQLLTELDGVQPLRRVVIVAATNRPDLLDPALMRPGRIDRKVYVPPPDLASRQEILAISLRGVPTEGLNIHTIARRTEGFSGAEVVAVCKEAALAAIEENPTEAKAILPHHMDRALTKFKPQITNQMLEFYKSFSKGLLKSR